MCPIIRIFSIFVTIIVLTNTSSGVNQTTTGQTSGVNREPPLRIITGTVKDEKGQPVKDALITATIPYIDKETLTDSDGKFRFRTGISLVPTGMTSTRPSPLEETQNLFVRQKERNLCAEIKLDDKTDNYEITLSPGVIFSGKVFDVNGTGIPKAEISLGFWMSDRGSIRQFEEPTKIDSEGNFEIRAVPYGHKYSFSATADGYGEQSVQTNTNEAGKEHINLEPLVLNIANLSISGIVVDQNDQPISNARVSSNGYGQPSMRETRTNSKGEFTLEKICAGSIVIEVRKEGPEHFTGRATAKGGDKNIKIVISSNNSAIRRGLR